MSLIPTPTEVAASDALLRRIQWMAEYIQENHSADFPLWVDARGGTTQHADDIMNLCASPRFMRTLIVSRKVELPWPFLLQG